VPSSASGASHTTAMMAARTAIPDSIFFIGQGFIG
jgi:hypothetical protein